MLIKIFDNHEPVNEIQRFATQKIYNILITFLSYLQKREFVNISLIGGT